MKKILVTYASKYGATQAIAEAIAQTLKQAEFHVEVKPAHEANAVDDYDGVILGSAVYAGSWRKEAVTFLEKHEASLSKRPVWFFSSGPTGEGDDPVTMMKGWRFPQAQQALADRIQPQDIAFFHGVLDMNKLNFAERMIIRGMKVPTGDYRDWDMIQSWAQGIAEFMKQSMVNQS